MPPKLRINRHLYDKAIKNAMGSFESKPLFFFKYNLDSRNKYAYGICAGNEKEIHYCAEDSEISTVAIKDMEDIEYIQYIGCAAIEYTFEGERYELCRSDMKNALAMQNAVRKLKLLSKGKSFVKTDEREDSVCCPKCGTPYRGGSKICPNCTDKKRLLTKILPYARPYIVPLIISVLLVFAVTGLSVYSGKINKELINGYLFTSNPGTKSGFIGIILIMAGIELLNAVFPMIRQIMLVKVGSKIILALRRKVYEKVQQMSLSGISKRTAGEIITRVTQDTNVIRDFLTSTLCEVLRIVLTFAALIVIMLTMNWKLTLLILIPVPLIVVVFYLTRTFMNSMYHRQWVAESNINTLLHDTFSGIRVVKVFGTEEHENERFSKAARKVADLSQQNEKTWNLIMPFVNFFMEIGQYAVLFIMGTQIIQGKSDLGSLSQFLIYVSLLYGPLRQAAFLPRQFVRSMTSMAKVFELIDEKSDIADSGNAVEKPIDGNIHFEKVSFGYNNYEDVLKNITLDINKGEMVGIVGRSGVGKSTLINLIMRLYDVTEGGITIDGVDLRDYEQHCLRSQIGVVLQETFLFKGTIYSNIAYAKPGCTRDEVIRASKLANAHQFIMKQPDGYNTIVGERGQTLSGGERQRIAIARAILRNPRILVLDEATASLDTKTEKLIQDAINQLISGRTTIAIAHRLSTLRNATKLVVLEKGEIEESGTHDELIANGKRYYKLVMAQRQMSKMKK